MSLCPHSDLPHLEMVSSGVEAATAFVLAAESSAADLLPLLVAVHFLFLQILPGDIKSASHDSRHHKAPPNHFPLCPSHKKPVPTNTACAHPEEPR